MKKIAVLGANGLLGNDLVLFLSKYFDVTPITRENYEEFRNKKFDVFINANGNSKRFWALQNIFLDFEVSTTSVYKTIFDFKFKKYIYISSIDVYPDHSNPESTDENSVIDINQQNAYGFHKYLSEQIVKKNLSDWIILRPSSILGKNLKKGPFFDLLNHNPIFVTLDTKLQLITTEVIAEIINLILKKSIECEILNIGGVGVFEFINIGKYFDYKIKVSSKAEKQLYNMNINKLKRFFSNLRTSEEYLQQFLK